jgi:hypothetical protein
VIGLGVGRLNSVRRPVCGYAVRVSQHISEYAGDAGEGGAVGDGVDLDGEYVLYASGIGWDEPRGASTCSLGGAVLCGGARVSGRERHPGCDQCLREVGGASASPACLRAWTELDRTNLSPLLLFSPFL